MDMTAIYKSFHGDFSVGRKLFTPRPLKKQLRSEAGKYVVQIKPCKRFFTVRVARKWNSLPQLVALVGNVAK